MAPAAQPEITENREQIEETQFMSAAGAVGRRVSYRLPLGQPVDANIEKAADEQAKQGKNEYQICQPLALPQSILAS